MGSKEHSLVSSGCGPLLCPIPFTPPASASGGLLMPPELIKLKGSSKSWLFTALNTAAAVPGVVDWIQWPCFFSLPHPHTLCCVTLQFLLLETRYPSQPFNIELGQGTCFDQWDVIKYDANRSLNCAWPVGLLSLRCEEDFPRIPLIQGWRKTIRTEPEATCSLEPSSSQPESAAL